MEPLGEPPQVPDCGTWGSSQSPREVTARRLSILAPHLTRPTLTAIQLLMRRRSNVAAHDDELDVHLNVDMAWVQFLPVDDQHTMMQELAAARSSSQRKRLLHEWRVTAEALRDPNARALLLREDDEDDDGALQDRWTDF